jgi:hypothetical protein
VNDEGHKILKYGLIKRISEEWRTTTYPRVRIVAVEKDVGSSPVGHPLRSRIRTRKTDQRLDSQRGAGNFLRHVLQHLDLVFSTVGQTGYERSYQILRQFSDEEIEAALTAIRGIGPWRVHGFVSIALDRPDVVLAGDLAIRRAVKKVYGLDHMPTAQQVLQIAERWRPYRSLAVYYLFASESQI